MFVNIVNPVDVKPDIDSKQQSKNEILQMLRQQGTDINIGIVIYPIRTIIIFSYIEILLSFFFLKNKDKPIIKDKINEYT